MPDDSVIVNLPPKDFPANISRIGSIVIAGQVFGTLAGADNYAFEAQQIGSIKIGGVALHLTAGTDNFTLSASTGSDVRVREF